MKKLLTIASLALLALILTEPATAGVFNLPKFINPGESALGIEPEVTFTNDGGVAANLRYQYGLTDLNNVTAILGSGTGVRRFRVGGAFTFDFFPDIDKQPGIGIATQGIYYRYKGFGQFDLTLIPYVHKAFYNGEGNQVEPYFALPFGPEFRSGNYTWAAQTVLGAMFRTKDSPMNFLGEVGVSVNKAETYISGGIMFQLGAQ